MKCTVCRRHLDNDHINWVTNSEGKSRAQCSDARLCFEYVEVGRMVKVREIARRFAMM